MGSPKLKSSRWRKTSPSMLLCPVSTTLPCCPGLADVLCQLTAYEATTHSSEVLPSALLTVRQPTGTILLSNLIVGATIRSGGWGPFASSLATGAAVAGELGVAGASVPVAGGTATTPREISRSAASVGWAGRLAPDRDNASGAAAGVAVLSAAGPPERLAKGAGNKVTSGVTGALTAEAAATGLVEVGATVTNATRAPGSWPGRARLGLSPNRARNTTAASISAQLKSVVRFCMRFFLYPPRIPPVAPTDRGRMTRPVGSEIPNRLTCCKGPLGSGTPGSSEEAGLDSPPGDRESRPQGVIG